MTERREITTAADRAMARRRYVDESGREWTEDRPRLRPARDADLESPRTPAGFRKITLTAYTDGRHVVILEQEPFWLPCEDEPGEHDCDAMGCGWEHILARFNVPQEKPAAQGGASFSS